MIPAPEMATAFPVAARALTAEGHEGLSGVCVPWGCFVLQNCEIHRTYDCVSSWGWSDLRGVVHWVYEVGALYDIWVACECFSKSRDPR